MEIDVCGKNVTLKKQRLPTPLILGGMRNSLMADTKGQGKAAISFFTEDKIITGRGGQTLNIQFQEK